MENKTTYRGYDLELEEDGNEMEIFKDGKLVGVTIDLEYAEDLVDELAG